MIIVQIVLFVDINFRRVIVIYSKKKKIIIFFWFINNDIMNKMKNILKIDILIGNNINSDTFVIKKKIQMQNLDQSFLRLSIPLNEENTTVVLTTLVSILLTTD